MGRLADLVERYFDACTRGDAEDVAALFTDDAVIYDTNVAPVRGAETIGPFWVRTGAAWHGARWSVDRVVEAGDEAASEWTMTGELDGKQATVRGSEHYRFEGDRIAEIRQYWTFDRDHPDTGLVGYPYDGAGAD